MSGPPADAGDPRLAPVGLVLAGGRSARMGEDKGRLDAGGESLAARAARRLRAVCAEVAVADRGRRLLPGPPELPSIQSIHQSIRSIPDGAGEGPIAGLLGGALAYPGRSLLALACDLPEIPIALLAEIGKPSGFDWVVPRWRGRLEPLCALYRPPALAALAANVSQGALAPHLLAEVAGLSVRYLDGALLARFGAPEAMFVNLNGPEDVRRWRERPGSG
jgi:molybdopterin-guanine dinucleotide biosynthesis protein A